MSNEDRLIAENRGLVKTIVRQFNPKNRNEFEEYEQAGLIGLLKAIRKHDANKGKLTTIAFYYITGEISRYIKKEKKSIGLGGFELDKLCCVTKFSVNDYLTKLTPVEQQIIDMRVKGYTFKEIGSILGGYSRGWANNVYRNLIKRIVVEND